MVYPYEDLAIGKVDAEETSATEFGAEGGIEMSRDRNRVLRRQQNYDALRLLEGGGKDGCEKEEYRLHRGR